MGKASISIISIWFLMITLFISFKKTKKLTTVCDSSTPTYNSDIKAIIDNNRMGSFGHSVGSLYGNFSTYTGLTSYITDRLFKRGVIELQIMPKKENPA